MNEFELIDRYFKRPHRCKKINLGIGDDAALVRVPEGQELAITVDTLVSGVHFLETTSAYDIGWKALAVSLSDLAAMGADPAWITLALTLPEIDHSWLKLFSQGLFDLADQHEVDLIGGDTTRGPLSITLQAYGFVQPGQAIRRAGAQPGDLIHLTGTLGDAAGGLLIQQGHLKPAEMSIDETYLIHRLNRPSPRVSAGLALRGLASAAIDISDGLNGDLGHLLTASGQAAGLTAFGATVYLDCLPCSRSLKRYPLSWEHVISGGDDYELCFTIPPERLEQFDQIRPTLGCSVSVIGVIQKNPGLIWLNTEGEFVKISQKSFQHF